MTIPDFLYHEATLLDSGQFDAWLALFHPEGIYWLPSQLGQSDALETASIIYEDVNLLRLRVQRLQHPRAHALEPAPRTLHQVSNIRIARQESRCAHVQSGLVVVVYRAGKQSLYAAQVQHELSAQDDCWRIRQKRVELLNCDGVHDVLSVLF
jgi:benzoate/toluate 1,2-dioxygenase beta subunit